MFPKAASKDGTMPMLCAPGDGNRAKDPDHCSFWRSSLTFVEGVERRQVECVPLHRNNIHSLKRTDTCQN